MINTVTFSERPEAVVYAALPDGKADVWLRKNIRETVVQEDVDGETMTVTAWTAEEAYMRTRLALAEISADFDGIFGLAGAFRQGDDEEKPVSVDERIAALESENASLMRQLTDTQLALCELYEFFI